jgi:predicted type IV restriction endonuclease
MPPDFSESEWQTRKKRIDTRLTALGWKIVPFAPARPLSAYTLHAVTEFATANGPADYALCVNGRILGIVEAKKLSLGPQNVLVQAERYSRGAAVTVAVAAGDTVSSTWLIRGEDGKEYKPEDYLAAFARFVKENPAQIEAIRILLNRPQEWGTDALGELRTNPRISYEDAIRISPRG